MGVGITRSLKGRRMVNEARERIIFLRAWMVKDGDSKREV